MKILSNIPETADNYINDNRSISCFLQILGNNGEVLAKKMQNLLAMHSVRKIFHYHFRYSCFQVTDNGKLQILESVVIFPSVITPAINKLIGGGGEDEKERKEIKTKKKKWRGGGRKKKKSRKE